MKGRSAYLSKILAPAGKNASIWGETAANPEIEGEMSTVVTRSRIRGVFKGWSGRGIHELVNGQRWEQVSRNHQYRCLFSPPARVVAHRGSYWLEVEGMEERVEVRRR